MPCKERMIKVLRTENYGIGYYNYSCDNGEFSTAVISKNYKTLPYQLCNKISKEFGIYNMNRTDIISIVVKILKEYLKQKKLDTYIEADGGINLITIEDVNEAGVDIAVVGNGILKSDNYKETVRKLKYNN